MDLKSSQYRFLCAAVASISKGVENLKSVLSAIVIPKFTDGNVFCCCFQPVKSIIHALGHNRARQRDKLAHLLEEFAALQDEVDFIAL